MFKHNKKFSLNGIFITFLFIILVYHHVYIGYMTLNVRNSSKSLKIIIFAIFCVKFAIGSRRLPTPKKFSLPVS